MGFGPRALFFAPIKAAVLIPQLGIEGALYNDAITVSVVSLFAPALMCDPPSEWSSGPVSHVGVHLFWASSTLASTSVWFPWFVLHALAKRTQAPKVKMKGFCEMFKVRKLEPLEPE